MKRVRIVLANRPRMMREVVRGVIERQQDMEVVGEVVNALDLLVLVREMEPDAVIMGVRNSGEPGVCSHLLAEYPNLTILCLSSEGGAAFIEQLCPRRRDIIEPSEANILNALRQAIHAPCTSKEELTHRQRQ